MDDSHYHTRIQIIGTAVSEGRGVVAYGHVPQRVLDSFRRYGASVAMEGPCENAETVISFDHADRLDADELPKFFDAIEGARAIVLFGRDRSRKPAFEQFAFSRGYSVHPSYFMHVAYEDPCLDGYWSILRGPDMAETDGNLPFGWYDATRETGSRADALMMRHVLAARFTRPGDAVLVCTSNIGYAADIVRTVSECANVSARLGSREAVDYARSRYRQDGLSYDLGGPNEPFDDFDNSFDVVMSFDTIRSADEAQKLVAESWRVLRPGGRIVLGVELTKSSPASTVNMLVEAVKGRFTLESLWQQTVGEEATGNGRTVKIVPQADATEAAGMFTVVAFKDALAGRDGYVFKDTIYPYPDPTGNFLAFARDYENPLLMRSMFGIGVRVANGPERIKMAGNVIAMSSPGSADTGAALCVIGYSLLDNGTTEDLRTFLARIETYRTVGPVNWHARRWAISLTFLSGIMLQRLGELRLAVEAYDSVIESEWLAFSPTLGTKAAEAAYRAGMILFQQGDVQAARQFWSRGMAVAKQIMAADWKEVVGDEDCPLPESMRETIQALDIARRCGDCLRLTSVDEYRSAYSRWKSMTDDLAMASLRDLAVAQSADSATRDADRWRRMVARVRSNKWLYWLVGVILKKR